MSEGFETSKPLPDALAVYDDLALRLIRQRPVVFLDYDGTLTPIVDRPDQAVLDDNTRDTLQRLARHCTVGIISGRDRADVTKLVGIDNLIYAGSHGFDITGPDGLHMQHERAVDYLPALDDAEARLHDSLDGVSGALIERKQFAVAAHFRLVAAADMGRVEDAIESAAAANPQLRRTGGKKVFELRPQLPWDKGKAVLWLLEALDLQRDNVVPVYIGDDETDEDAFGALREHGGIGLYVGNASQATKAHYRLENTRAVTLFLSQLVDTLETMNDRRQ